MTTKDWHKKVIKRTDYCRFCEANTIHVKMVSGEFQCTECTNIETTKVEGKLFGIKYWE